MILTVNSPHYCISTALAQMDLKQPEVVVQQMGPINVPVAILTIIYQITAAIINVHKKTKVFAMVLVLELHVYHVLLVNM